MDGVQEEGRDEEETGGRYERGSLAAPTHNKATTCSAHIHMATCAMVSQTLGRESPVRSSLVENDGEWQAPGASPSQFLQRNALS